MVYTLSPVIVSICQGVTALSVLLHVMTAQVLYLCMHCQLTTVWARPSRMTACAGNSQARRTPLWRLLSPHQAMHAARLLLCCWEPCPSIFPTRQGCSTRQN